MSYPAMTIEEKLVSEMKKLKTARNKLKTQQEVNRAQFKEIKALRKQNTKDRQGFENALFRLQGGLFPNMVAGIKKQFSIG